MLFRTVHHSAALELELTRRNIPFVKFGGLKFLEAAHVKDVLAVLRLAENPRGRLAGFRVAAAGAGHRSGERAPAAGRDGARRRPAAALRRLRPAAAGADAWPRLRALLADLRGADAGWPAELERVRAWYAPQLERLHDDARGRAGRPRCSWRRSPPAMPRASAS